jgi:GTP-binding protein
VSREVAAEFVLSAFRPSDFPPPGLPEIAFLGRSNVGKSSLLNSLLGQRLAFVSSTPGRTQSINFFRVDGRWMFVDLPGYGYAKVPAAVAADWKQTIEAYLLDRPALACAYLLLDARRGWMKQDLQLKQWLEHNGRPFLVIATKADKLNQKEKRESELAFRKHYRGEMVWYSSVTGEGVKPLWNHIWKTKTS